MHSAPAEKHCLFRRIPVNLNPSLPFTLVV